MLGRSGRRGRPAHPDVLTPAEWRVLEHLREGRTNAEIAVRLGISPDGVKFHVSNMLAKLNLPDRQALAKWDGIEGATAQSGRRSWLGALWASLPGAGAVKAALAVAVVAVAGGVLATAVALLSGDSDASAIPDAACATLKVTSFDMTTQRYVDLHLKAAPGARRRPPNQAFGIVYANGVSREEVTTGNSPGVTVHLQSVGISPGART